MNLRMSMICVVLAVSMLVSSESSASMVIQKYRVCDTDVVNAKYYGEDAPHGFWSNQYYDTPVLPQQKGLNYFSIDGYLTEIMVGTERHAVLEATAVNPIGKLAVIDLTFKDFSETLPAGYDFKPEHKHDDNIQWFYSSVMGTITIDGVAHVVNHMVPLTTLQMGDKANAKDNDFGASAWVKADNLNYHWDLNLDLKPVPEPSTVAVWSILGLMGLGAMWMKRRRK